MINKHPLFSIIIPTYNRADKLRRALESVEKQSFKNYEVLVCDDGSTDDTKSVIDSFAERMPLTYLWEENWGGPARPRNNGIKIARGEWICFLDADDWWYVKKLATVIQYMKDADVVHHSVDIFTDQKKYFLKMRGRSLKRPVFVDLMTKGNALMTSGVCVRRSVFEIVSLFSEDKELLSVEDFDLWLRIAQVTERFVYIPESLASYFLWEGNISQSADHYQKTHHKIYNKFMGSLSKKDRFEAEKILAYCIGAKLQDIGMSRVARKHFYLSVRSRYIDTMLRSVVRIIISFFRRAMIL